MSVVINGVVAGFSALVALGPAAARLTDPVALSPLTPAAFYRLGTAQVVGAGVDNWPDASGNVRDLRQTTDTNRPTLNADWSITFDGVDNFLKAAAFTLNQPETVYFLGAQVTWTNNDYVYDGEATNSGLIFQNAVTPVLRCYAGTDVVLADSPAVNTDCVLTVVFNGASSRIQRNNGTASTGDTGAANMGGFTLGARGDGTGAFSNIRVKEVIIFAAAHDASVRARVIRYLMTLGGVS